MAGREDLIIRSGSKEGVGQLRMGVDGVAVVVSGRRQVTVGETDGGCDSEETAKCVAKLSVEVEKEMGQGRTVIERSEVFFIIIEKRGFAVGRNERLPMLMSPASMFGDTYIANGHLQMARFFHRDGE